MKADEIQERLIKNKTLLNVVEPTLENTSLEVGADSDADADIKRLMLYNLLVKLKLS